MQTIERPGIDLKWSKSWKADCKNLQGWYDQMNQSTLDNLKHYAESGSHPKDVLRKVREYNPPYKNWERFSLSNDLSIYGLLRLFELEKNGMSGIPFDTNLALNAFAAFLTARTVEFETHNKAQIRLGKPMSNLQMEEVLYCALGMVIGCKEESAKLTRMYIAAYYKGWIEDTWRYPIFAFILRLLADYLGEDPLTIHGAPTEEPIFQALFEHWKIPDPEDLALICLAACDYHTRSCKYDTEGEFYSGRWTRLPIEILLLFKMRQLSGLQNPKLDHPLMNTPLGVLPEEVSFQPNALIQCVRERMILDGYDEDAIYAESCKD
ncbi:hypothetical protein ACO0LM_16570 [Undibacterium sp. Di26W]|uniref:hypothetical protein n=1 Tax=Undibacterium sp. Di26W TaxID=3413035 RepID=UPI003BEFFF6A